MFFLKKIKKFIITYRYVFWIWKDPEKRSFIRKLRVFPSTKTIDLIKINKCNVCRFGDGEFYVMSGKSNGFQRVDDVLANRLKEVLANKRRDVLLCIPYTLKSFNGLTQNSKLFAVDFIHNNLKERVIPFVNTNISYGDSLFTRFYMSKRNKSVRNVGQYVSRLKSIWDGQDILIVEGEYSRSGVGNDLFNCANTIKRILCPPKDAFDFYDRILSCIIKNGKDKLVLMALGMAATVLAYDLAKENIWAIDLGHIDMEYEWFLMGAKKKTAIENKIVDEIENKNNFNKSISDKVYLSQIIEIIK